MFLFLLSLMTLPFHADAVSEATYKMPQRLWPSSLGQTSTSSRLLRREEKVVFSFEALQEHNSSAGTSAVWQSDSIGGIGTLCAPTVANAMACAATPPSGYVQIGYLGLELDVGSIYNKNPQQDSGTVMRVANVATDGTQAGCSQACDNPASVDASYTWTCKAFEFRGSSGRCDLWYGLSGLMHCSSYGAGTTVQDVCTYLKETEKTSFEADEKCHAKCRTCTNRQHNGCYTCKPGYKRVNSAMQGKCNGPFCFRYNSEFTCGAGYVRGTYDGKGSTNEECCDLITPAPTPSPTGNPTVNPTLDPTPSPTPAPTPACAAHTCPDGWADKTSKDSIDCSAGTCDDFECCNPTTKCSDSSSNACCVPSVANAVNCQDVGAGYPPAGYEFKGYFGYEFERTYGSNKNVRGADNVKDENGNQPSFQWCKEACDNPASKGLSFSCLGFDYMGSASRCDLWKKLGQPNKKKCTGEDNGYATIQDKCSYLKTSR